MIRKFKFYALGLIPGIILVLFILNKKGAQCSGYLPNSRVIAESLSKKFTYSPSFETEMKAVNVDEKFLRDSIMGRGVIDFDRSNAQKKPCPEYLLFSTEENPQYEITFLKCEKELTFLTLKKKK